MFGDQPQRESIVARVGEGQVRQVVGVGVRVEQRVCAAAIILDRNTQAGEEVQPTAMPPPLLSILMALYSLYIRPCRKRLGHRADRDWNPRWSAGGRLKALRYKRMDPDQQPQIPTVLPFRTYPG